MRIAIQVNTNKRALRPTPDNIIIYDGKDWYVTTKKELFKEYDEHFEQKLKECDRKIQEIENYRVELAGQMLEINDMVKALIIKEKEIK